MNAQSANPEDDRLRILRMVEEGKISAAEGISLLEAMGQGRKPARNPGRPAPGAGAAGGNPRWLRVRVTDLYSGRSKATVNIPFGLMDWGLRIGAQFAPEMADYDLQELTRVLSEEGVNGKIVDVTDDEGGEHVEIYVD
jgi:SHOCT-like domain